MRKAIGESIRPVIAGLQHVEIDRGGVGAFCQRHPAVTIDLPDWRHDFIYPWDDEAAADFFLLFNCINFAFWAKGGSVKWRIEYKGRGHDGAYGLMGALTRALEEGVPILDGAFLSEMTEKQLREILRGEGDLVLLPERVEILREVGRGLVGRYGGRFRGLVRDARGSAVALARLLVDQFPSFGDTCRTVEGEVKFYKRAQLSPAMIYQRFRGAGPGAFRDIDDLTVFADYKLPQALRRAGVLRYGEALAAKVDSRTLIPPCSREEIEIRACTIWACELIMAEYARMGQKMNAVTLDAFLWLLAHEKVAGDKPYHLTETIYY
jgi:hypothetical protein